MNLHELTYIELHKLYFQLGIEILSRSWWVMAILVVVFVGLMHLIDRRMK